MAIPNAMNTKWGKAVVSQRGMILPLGALALMVVLLVPLPTQLMDFLLAGNITLAAVVLLTVMYISGPLEFSSFPSLLLAMTLFRLVLNTATTRLILTNAQDGTMAAGKVIETFGTFVAGGSLMVGVIIFAIIVIIQFVVITKGATRIAEVAARFTLDGMPGKQMAVDADLNAGVINEREAKLRPQNGGNHTGKSDNGTNREVELAANHQHGDRHRQNADIRSCLEVARCTAWAQPCFGCGNRKHDPDHLENRAIRIARDHRAKTDAHDDRHGHATPCGRRPSGGLPNRYTSPFPVTSLNIS